MGGGGGPGPNLFTPKKGEFLGEKGVGMGTPPPPPPLIVTRSQQNHHVVLVLKSWDLDIVPSLTAFFLPIF